MFWITRGGDIFKRNIIGLQKDQILKANVSLLGFNKISFSKYDTFIYASNIKSVVVFKEDDNKEWIKSYEILLDNIAEVIVDDYEKIMYITTISEVV